MAITVYSGRPGGGKSYGVVENVILPSLKLGRTIVTNMPLEMPAIYQAFPDAEVILFDNAELQRGLLDLDTRADLRGAVFVIDECWKFWPNGQRVTDLPAHQRAFFSEHRHYVGSSGLTTEIVLVCQSLAQITPAIRELVDSTYIVSKLDKLAQAGKYRVDIYSGPQQLTRPDFHQLVRKAFGHYRADVYKFYKSHTRNDSGFDAGLESPADKRGNIWSSPFWRYFVPACALIGAFGVWGVLSWLDGSRFRDAENPVVVSSAGSLPVDRSAFPARSILPAAAASDSLPLSPDWRIAAVLQRGASNRGWAILVDSEGRERTIPLTDHCTSIRRTPDWTCRVDGFSVTFYSGSAQGRRSELSI